MILATDGSKTRFRATNAAIDFSNNKKISGEVDVYYNINALEAVAIIVALRHLATDNKKYVILTDSMNTIRDLKKKSSLSYIVKLNSELQNAI